MQVPSSSYIIVPTQVTSEMLVSCTVPEPSGSETVWNAATNYSIGTEVIRTTTHKKYKRLIAGTTATPPESDPSDPPNWLDIGATNRWAQFDQKVGTKTTQAAGPLTVVLKPGSIEGIAILDLYGQSIVVTMRESTGGPVVYEKSIVLDNTAVTSVYDWMYTEYVQQLNVVLLDLPGQFYSNELTIQVYGSSGCSIGSLVVGRVHSIGNTQYGAGAGVINWGKVNEDGFGNRQWVPGEWSNRVTLPIVAGHEDMPRIHRILANVRSTPCVYVGSAWSIYEPLICYGVYRDLYITIPNYGLLNMNLEVEGLNNV